LTQPGARPDRLYVGTIRRDSADIRVRLTAGSSKAVENTRKLLSLGVVMRLALALTAVEARRDEIERELAERLRKRRAA